MSKKNASSPLRTRFSAYIRRRQWSSHYSLSKREVADALHASDEDVAELIAEFATAGKLQYDAGIRRYRVLPRERQCHE